MTRILAVLALACLTTVACRESKPGAPPTDNGPVDTVPADEPADQPVEGPVEEPGEPLPGTEPTAEEPNCGGMQGLACAEDQYCDFPEDAGASCGIADGMGVCRPRPEMCTEQYDPVCGCDGKTHSNACHAAMAGTDVMQKGECPEG